MSKDAARYERMLRRKLRCTRDTKNRLMDKFRASLAELREEKPEPTMADLKTAFGPPEKMAGLLSKGITDAESRRYRKTVLFRRVLAGVALAAFLAFTVYIYFFKEIGLTIYEEKYVIDRSEEKNSVAETEVDLE